MCLSSRLGTELTRGTVRHTIDLVLRGRLFTALMTAAISISVPGAALAGCMSGLSDEPTMQMACCKGGHHECHKSGSVVDCCKASGHEHQQNVPDQQNIAKTFSITKISGGTSVLADVLQVTQHPLIARSLPWVPLFAGTSSPPRFAFSILLI